MPENQDSKNEMKKHIGVLVDKIDTFLVIGNPSDVLIIKAHLICEYYLNQILILKGLRVAREIDKLTFHQKRCIALDTSNKKEHETSEALAALNRLRNRVGHELEYKLTEADVDSLGYCDGKDYILQKYELENNLQELLVEVLKGIVIDASVCVYRIVKSERQAKTANPLGKSSEAQDEKNSS